jgi:hypothetical protein
MRKAAALKRASGKMKVRRAEGAFFLSSQTFATKSALPGPPAMSAFPVDVSRQRGRDRRARGLV